MSRAGRLGIGLVGFVLVVGPWPMLDAPYTATDSFRDTARRLEQTPVACGNGPLRVGTAEVELTPAMPVPVAGFIDQIMQPYVGINSRCFGRALTLAVGPTTVTIVTADLLLIDAALARRVVARTGLPHDQIFFTATHTHSGPGGWGNHPLERLVAGTYDPEVVADLTERLARAVATSRARLRSAEVAFVQTQAPGLTRNRIDPGRATNDTLAAWVFRAVGPPDDGSTLATFTSFGAHATIGHPKPPRLGGDYPAALVADLQGNGGLGMVSFAAGTVGDASPVRPPGANQQQSVQTYGHDLAGRLLAILSKTEFHREIALANFRLDVDLPPIQVPFLSSRLRFSPLAFWWVAPRRSHLHTLRLGPAWLVGFPGDLAGHLQPSPDFLPVIATSFNGDYKGYLVSRSTFQGRSCYETRWMNFFGPDLGEALVDLSRSSIRRIWATGLDSPR